ncbi:MAG: RDD family protein [bacterium]|nr:RDD family protein [bacterium]
MYIVKIKTTQNVDIEYEIAGIGDRILAGLIDYGVLGILFLVCGSIAALLKLEWEVFKTVLLLYLLFCSLYDLLCEVLLGGQSIGKKILRIKVVKLDGSRTGIGSYLLRSSLRFIDITLFSSAVAIITILKNGKGQRLGDIAAGTTVVKIKPRVSLDDTILVQLAEDYEPRFPEAKELNDEVSNLIKEALLFADRNKDTAQAENMLLKAKQRLEQRMEINTQMDPGPFLETVLNDYNYYSGKVE